MTSYFCILDSFPCSKTSRHIGSSQFCMGSCSAGVDSIGASPYEWFLCSTSIPLDHNLQIWGLHWSVPMWSLEFVILHWRRDGGNSCFDWEFPLEPDWVLLDCFFLKVSIGAWPGGAQTKLIGMVSIGAWWGGARTKLVVLIDMGSIGALMKP